MSLSTTNVSAVTVSELLKELAQRNIKLSARDDKLTVNAAKGALTPELQQRLASSKSEILAVLQGAKQQEPEQALPVIVPDISDINKPFPMSDLQLGFYMADDPYMEYHVRPHYFLENDRLNFNIERYENAWNKALKRHRNEINIVNRDLQLELVQEWPSIKCQVTDLRHMGTDMAKRELLNYRKNNMRQELPLDSWPWFQLSVTLWRDGDEEKSRVYYNHNNFFIDGFAMSKLLNEVEAYYEDPDLQLPALTLSYRDAVLALQDLEQTTMGQKAKYYWLKRLPHMPPPPPLPKITEINTRCRSKLQRRAKTLSAEIWTGFKARSASYGVTPSNGILAAYAKILSLWSNSKHFILSQMVTRRFSEMHPEIKQILGNFASLYPLEIDLRENEAFYQQVRRIQEQVLNDIKHLQFGGMQVMQELNRLKQDFGSSPSPFVVGSVLFAENYKKSDFTCLETSQTLLDHQFWELADGSYYYVWDLLEEFFPESVIDSMWNGFETLLIQLSENENAWQQQGFNLLNKEYLLAREKCNRTAEPLPEFLLQDFLKNKLVDQKRVNNHALVDETGTLSYQRLAGWSFAVSQILLDNNVHKGQLVAVVTDRCQGLMASVLGILQVGAAYVPVDPSLPTERIHYLLQNSGASVVLTQDCYATTLQWPEQTTVICVDNYPQLSAIQQQQQIAVEDLAYVIYTSGSTGQPKGVMINHLGAVNTILDINRRFNITSSDKILGVSSFSFDLSVYDIFGSLAAGACLFFPNKSAAMNPAHWLEIMLDQGITVWNSVPALMSLLVDTAIRQKVQLPDLRIVLLSGDKIPINLPEQIQAVAPQARVISLGGATEASIWSIIYPITHVEKHWNTIPYGYSMVNQSWHILDSHGFPSPTWVPGELYIGGHGLAMGYWQDEIKTNNSFIVHPYSGERLYRTGDLGRYLPDGCIEFLGRVDFQVKIQGHRIELGEIEAALLEHAGIKEAVVTAQSVSDTNTLQLVAYLVLAETDEIDFAILQAFLREKLPIYMVPNIWSVLPELPITANGKVDRKALPPVQSDNTETTTGRQQYIAPTNETEKRLADIWSEVLNQSDIGIRDDFFDIGGQSFDAVRIFAFIQEQFGQTFTLGDIWSMRTIEQFAARLSSADSVQQFHYLIPIEITNRKGQALFLVHPAGGHTLGYRELAKQLSMPVYGFQAQGVDGQLELHESITEMATAYLAELKKVQNEGPYILGGWSSGAMIAFAMAAQLEAAGETIEQLYFLDGPPPVAHEDVSDEKLLAWFMEDLNLNLPLRLLEGINFSELSLLDQLATAAKCFLSSTDTLPDVEQLLPVYKVFRNVVIAGCHYHAPIIQADLTVVRVEDNIVSEFSTHPGINKEDWGWSVYSKGVASSAVVEGNHHTFLMGDSVRQVAEIIKAGLSDSKPKKSNAHVLETEVL